MIYGSGSILVFVTVHTGCQDYPLSFVPGRELKLCGHHLREAPAIRMLKLLSTRCRARSWSLEGDQRNDSPLDDR